MNHPVFGDITWSKGDEAWSGVCALPTFAQYGKLEPDNHMLDEPSPEFLRGEFKFEIRDPNQSGPSSRQVNAFQYLREHEREICQAVMTALVDACGMKGGITAWLQRRRESRFWGWLAKLAGPEYKTPDDLKQAVRCIRVEVSSYYVGIYAYIAFHFETIFGTETEHGLSVVYHPNKGTSYGDASAVAYLEDADVMNEEY